MFAERERLFEAIVSSFFSLEVEEVEEEESEEEEDDDDDDDGEASTVEGTLTLNS
jgi:hypothetical protein